MSKISAGSYDLNKWLHGGYDNDIITVIYGGSGAGKTNFCLLAAVSQAKKGKKVFLIDTEGGFSSERVKQIVGEPDKEEVDKVLENILLLKVTNFEEQKKIRQIKKEELDLLEKQLIDQKNDLNYQKVQYNDTFDSDSV